LRISEKGLRLHCAAYDNPTLRVRRATVVLELEQPLTSAQGDFRGVAHLQIRGRRVFGGLIDFDDDVPVSITGPFVEEEVPDLEDTARMLVRALEGLCECGEITADCSCET
jgi:hypothetical protein